MDSAADAERYLGIDVGTGGVRACLIDAAGEPVTSASAPMPAPLRDAAGVRQDAGIWWSALESALAKLGDLGAVRAVAVDGTSGTLLACDAGGLPCGPARMYNDASQVEHGRVVDAHAPADSPARGAGATLARALALLDEGGAAVRYLLHQADWIAARLSGRLGLSDANNCLKLGYDVVADRWPVWLLAMPFDSELLPEVRSPGTPVGPIGPDGRALGLPANCLVVSGTTDGNAAFAAVGDFEPGVAVSSLGSTLTVKLVSAEPVFAPAYGIYSHRLFGHWLAGGASNTGGAALARFFTPEEMRDLSGKIDPSAASGLDYYPLPATGERFPVNDPTLASRTEPRPASDAQFLHGLLESIARIERDAYARLADLGATPVREVRSVGGGAVNETWTQLREAALGVPVVRAQHTDAAFGTARIARAGALA